MTPGTKRLGHDYFIRFWIPKIKTTTSYLTSAVSSEAWAKLRDWASVAARGRLLLSGSVAHASLETAVVINTLSYLPRFYERDSTSDCTPNSVVEVQTTISGHLKRWLLTWRLYVYVLGWITDQKVDMAFYQNFWWPHVFFICGLNIWLSSTSHGSSFKVRNGENRYCIVST